MAVYFDAKLRAIYFDSFGLPPRNKRIINFLKRNCARWDYSRKVLQHPFSKMCGGYCIYFLVKKCQGQSLKAIVSPLSHDLDLNGPKIRRFFSRVFPYIPLPKLSNQNQAWLGIK